MFRSTRSTRLIALGLTAAALVPAAAQAAEDDDMRPGDIAGTTTTFAADGTTTSEAATYGARAFVGRLVREGAAGGSYASDFVGDARSPMRAATGLAEYDAPDGEFRQLSRSGYASPDTARYVRYKRLRSKAEALRRISARHFRNADGERVEERGWAVDIATGAVRKVSLAKAKALSLDPRGGEAGTEYVYQVFVAPAALR